MKYTVYKITNTNNGKSYVGLTSRTIAIRWLEHCVGAKKQKITHFQRAIQKYGKDAFVSETLWSGTRKRTCLEQEIYFIRLLQTRNKKFGYNITPGGDSLGAGRQHPRYRKDVSTRKIVSLYQKGLTQKQVAKKLGVGHGTVANRLRFAGVKMRRAGHNLLLAGKEKEIIFAYEQGDTITTLGTKYNVSGITVWELLKREGVHIRGRRGK